MTFGTGRAQHGSIFKIDSLVPVAFTEAPGIDNGIWYQSTELISNIKTYFDGLAENNGGSNGLIKIPVIVPALESFFFQETNITVTDDELKAAGTP